LKIFTSTPLTSLDKKLYNHNDGLILDFCKFILSSDQHSMFSGAKKTTKSILTVSRWGSRMASSVGSFRESKKRFAKNWGSERKENKDN